MAVMTCTSDGTKGLKDASIAPLTPLVVLLMVHVLTYVHTCMQDCLTAVLTASKMKDFNKYRALQFIMLFNLFYTKGWCHLHEERIVSNFKLW
jgi:hypothetical protein